MDIKETTEEELEAATAPSNPLPYSPIPGHMTADGVAPEFSDEVKAQGMAHVVTPTGPTPSKTPFDDLPVSSKRVSVSTRSSLKQYTVEKRTPETDFLVSKLPPQARLIYTTAVQMTKAGKKTFSSKELTDETVKAGLVTRQLPERIINYYLPRLRADKLFI
jgi:hypothetical protein